MLGGKSVELTFGRGREVGGEVERGADGAGLFDQGEGAVEVAGLLIGGLDGADPEFAGIGVGGVEGG